MSFLFLLCILALYIIWSATEYQWSGVVDNYDNMIWYDGMIHSSRLPDDSFYLLFKNERSQWYRPLQLRAQPWDVFAPIIICRITRIWCVMYFWVTLFPQRASLAFLVHKWSKPVFLHSEHNIRSLSPIHMHSIVSTLSETRTVYIADHGTTAWHSSKLWSIICSSLLVAVI